MNNKKYWIFVTNDLNWNTIKKNNIYGFNDKNKRDLGKLSIGDLIIMYIKGKKIGGLFEIISLKSDDDIKFNEGNYPYKIKLKEIIVPKKTLDFSNEIIGNISIFRNTIRWGTILMGRSVKEITKEDYDYVKDILTKKNVRIK